MYALDSVKTVSVTKPVNTLPVEVQNAYKLYSEAKALVSDYYPERSTTSQKRTATMRFNKFCALCESLNIDVPSALMVMANQ